MLAFCLSVRSSYFCFGSVAALAQAHQPGSAIRRFSEVDEEGRSVHRASRGGLLDRFQTNDFTSTSTVRRHASGSEIWGPGRVAY